jgi:hypothetical protein
MLSSKEVFETIYRLMEPPQPAPMERRRIGFTVDNRSKL